MPNLEGKAAIVTGSTRGIGRAIAEGLAAAGASIVVSGRTQSTAEVAAQEIAQQTGARAVGVAADVQRYEDCRQLVQESVARLGRLDVLVNNAGIGHFASVADIEPDAWQRVLRTNLDGAFYCTREAIPHLRAAGGGWIVNIGSLAGKNPFAGGAAYNASKFGLLGFSEAVMLDVRHDGIRVSCIMPGSVATDFSHPSSGTGDAWRIQPADIARIVLDLLDTPARTLPSRIEVRPSMPPKK